MTPLLGVATTVERLKPIADWVLADQRDLEIQDFSSYQLLESDWRARAGELRAMLDGYTGRLGIHGPDPGPGTVGSWDPAIRAVVRDRLKRALEACVEIGATHMVVHSPFIFLGNHYLPNSPDMGHADYFEHTRDTLAELLPLAADAGLTFVIENIWDPHPGLIVGMVRALASEQIRMSIDTGHAYLSYARGAMPVDMWIREAGDLLFHVHLQDTDGYADRHWMPGVGDLNWGAVFDELAALTHQPRLILELRGDPRVAAAWLAERQLAR